ncbi:hypothetical protein MTO96_021489 [Rhipicephalus appendiculatus]
MDQTTEGRGIIARLSTASSPPPTRKTAAGPVGERRWTLNSARPKSPTPGRKSIRQTSSARSPPSPVTTVRHNIVVPSTPSEPLHAGVGKNWWPHGEHDTAHDVRTSRLNRR